MALSILTGVAGTVIFIDLTVHSCGSRWAVTLVGIDQINAASSVLTRVAVALLDLDITDGACISRLALTGEGGDAVFTHTMVAWFWYTVIDILLTKWTSEAFSTFTIISVWSIDTLSTIQTRRAGTLIDVYLAHFTTEACWAFADKAADLVQTFTLVQTGGAEALIHL